MIPKRKLGKTDLELPIVSFGASSLGQEFRKVRLEEALESVNVALELGMNFIDTSPFYGRGMSEVLLGIALRDVPRESYTLCSKLGRYDLQHFDFSAKRVAESVDVSLHRLGTDHLDIILCHDIEFVPMQQIVDETIPALRKIQETLLTNPADERTLSRWAAALGVQQRTLMRKLKSETGMTFRQWRRQIRILKAIEALATGSPVTSVAYDVGYQTTSAFIEAFRQHTGKTPARYFD